MQTSSQIAVVARILPPGSSAPDFLPAQQVTLDSQGLSNLARRMLAAMPRVSGGVPLVHGEDDEAVVLHEGQTAEDAVSACLERKYEDGGRVLMIRLCTIPEALVSECGDQARWASLDEEQIAFVEYVREFHPHVLDENGLSLPATTAPIPRHQVALPPGLTPDVTARVLEMPSCRKAMAEAAALAAARDQQCAEQTEAQLVSEFERFKEEISEKLLLSEEGLVAQEGRFEDLKAWVSQRHGDESAAGLVMGSSEATRFLDELRNHTFSNLAALPRTRKIRLHELENLLPANLKHVSRRMEVKVTTETAPATGAALERLAQIRQLAPMANVTSYLRTGILVHEGKIVATLKRPFAKVETKYRSIPLTRELALD